MLTTIGVIGRGMQHAEDPVDEKTLTDAREVGRLVALRGGVIISGGLGGVMEAVSQGAKDQRRPYDRHSCLRWTRRRAIPILDIAIPTGLGRARNLLAARGCDAVIMIGGGCGTLNELTISYAEARPVVILRGSGGWADRIEGVLYEGRYIDERRTVGDRVRGRSGGGRRKGFASARRRFGPPQETWIEASLLCIGEAAVRTPPPAASVGFSRRKAGPGGRSGRKPDRAAAPVHPPSPAQSPSAAGCWRAPPGRPCSTRGPRDRNSPRRSATSPTRIFTPEFGRRSTAD